MALCFRIMLRDSTTPLNDTHQSVIETSLQKFFEASLVMVFVNTVGHVSNSNWNNEWEQNKNSINPSVTEAIVL